MTKNETPYLIWSRYTDNFNRSGEIYQKNYVFCAKLLFIGVRYQPFYRYAEATSLIIWLDFRHMIPRYLSGECKIWTSKTHGANKTQHYPHTRTQYDKILYTFVEYTTFHLKWWKSKYPRYYSYQTLIETKPQIFLHHKSYFVLLSVENYVSFRNIYMLSVDDLQTS